MLKNKSSSGYQQEMVYLITMPKVVNKRSSDPFDRLIFEKGLRAKQVIADKKLNTLVVLLNNAMVIKVYLSNFSRLKKASQKQLNNWKLINGGIGIRWDELDEDLSIKGLIKDSAIISVLQQLQGKKGQGLTVV